MVAQMRPHPRLAAGHPKSTGSSASLAVALLVQVGVETLESHMVQPASNKVYRPRQGRTGLAPLKYFTCKPFHRKKVTCRM